VSWSRDLQEWEVGVRPLATGDCRPCLALLYKVALLCKELHFIVASILRSFFKY
jgi:hypothetical protein